MPADTLPHLAPRSHCRDGRAPWLERRIDGALLARAVEAGFDVLLTANRQMVRQHDFSRLPLAVVVTPGNQLRSLNILRDIIAAAVERATPGEYVEVPGSTAADETLNGSETSP